MKKLNLLSMVLALAVFGCKAYDESMLTNGSAGPPARPDPSTSDPFDNFSYPEDTNEVTFAIRDIFLKADGDQYLSIGVDVDDRNTVDPSNTECGTPALTPVPVDGQFGIDNAVGGPEILGLVSFALPCLEDDIALSQGNGFGTILLRVRKWNGLPNDASVEVAITQSVQGTSADPGEINQDFEYNSGPRAGEPADPPFWRGADSWYVDKADFINDQLDQPINAQPNAYVAKGRLVVPLLSTTPLELFTGEITGSIFYDHDGLPETADLEVPNDGNQGLQLKLSDGLLLGDIEMVDDPETEEVEQVPQIVRGIFTGRYGVNELLQATPKIGICDTPSTLGQEQSFDTNADVMLVPGSGSPDAICDALSLGIAFTAVGGHIVDFAQAPLDVTWSCPDVPEAVLPKPNRCCPSNSDSLYYQTNCGSPLANPETDKDPALYELFQLMSAIEFPVPIPDFPPPEN